MSEELDLNKFIQDKKSENFDENLKTLLEKDEKSFDTKDIKVLEEFEREIWKIYVAVDSLKYEQQNNPEVKEKTLELLEIYAQINEKLGNILMDIKPKNEEHHFSLLIGASQKYIIALQKKYGILNDQNVKSDLLSNSNGRVVCETESPYYEIKKLIGKVKSNYDEVSIWFLLKNDFKNAHHHYYFLGDVILKEIYYGIKINDGMLYSEHDFAFLYYNAGIAFLRGYNAMKEKLITVHYSVPIAAYFKSNISDLFNNGNIVIPINVLSIKCFERAIDLFKKIGNKEFYLKTKDILRGLKSELNNFEQLLLDLYIKISKQFTARSNVVTKSVDEPKKILEGDVRDYFLSHINVVRDELAFAESTRGREGFSDLLVVGKDYRENIINAIAEFKVWGRNSSGEHSYLNVVNQLKSYISDFESFGIVVMINPNQNSIRDTYLQKIINEDSLYVTDSLDEPYNETGFTNFKTEYYVDDTKTRKIRVYHLILNISNLYKSQEESQNETSS